VSVGLFALGLMSFGLMLFGLFSLGLMSFRCMLSGLMSFELFLFRTLSIRTYFSPHPFYTAGYKRGNIPGSSSQLPKQFRCGKKEDRSAQVCAVRVEVLLVGQRQVRSSLASLLTLSWLVRLVVEGY
jgi:hypothetical protein